MKRSSKSRTKERATTEARAALRLSLASERGYQCQACPECPDGAFPARSWTDMHEVLSRGRGGDPTDPDNILCLCRECHHFITVNPAWAEENGYARKRTAEEHQSAWRKTKP